MTSITSITEAKLITGEELFEMGDIGPCELIEGRIVPMSPAGAEHGFIELNLAHELKSFVSAKKLGWVLTGEVGIYTHRNPDTVRGADVIFISKKRLAKRPQRGFLMIAPELVVEIISPMDIWKEILEKIYEYFSIGVRWVWVVDPKERTCLVYRSSEEVQKLTENDTLIGEDILTGFTLNVSSIFKE